MSAATGQPPFPRSAMSDARISTLAGGLATGLIAAVISCRTALDVDLWGHLRFGVDILTSLRPAAIDQYSFTQDRPWINHEWLSEVIFALAFRGGVAGLVILKALVSAAACWVLIAATRSASGPYRWRIAAAGILCAAPALVAIRPQIWTVLGLALLGRLLQNRQKLLWLPVLFAVWANLHGGWLVGLAVAALFLLGEIIDSGGTRGSGRAIGIVSLAAAATLLNPYGWTLWRFLASTVGVTREVEEWRPLWEQGRPLAFTVLWLIVAVSIAAATVWSRPSSRTWRTLLPVGTLAVASIFVTRLVPLFSVVSVWSLSPAWTAPAEAPSATAGYSIMQRALRSALVGATALAIIGGPVRCLPINDWWTPDLAAAGALKTARATGTLVVPFNWGEFAIWHFGPALRVSIDGRRETLYSAPTVALQNRMAEGDTRAFDDLRPQPDYIWLPGRVASRLAPWLTAHDYVVDIVTPASFIARRSTLQRLQPAVPLRGCFP
jgi:hypothetical protein